MGKKIVTNKALKQVKRTPPIKPDDTKSSTESSGKIPVFVIGESK